MIQLLDLPNDTLLTILTYVAIPKVLAAISTINTIVKAAAYHNHVWYRLTKSYLTTVPLQFKTQTFREYYRDLRHWSNGDPRALVLWSPGPASARDMGLLIPRTTSLENASFTIEFYLQQTSFNAHNIVAQHTDWKTKGWALYFKNDTCLHFMVGNGFVTNQNISMSVPMSNRALEWMHVCATFDATTKTLSLYKNGVLDVTNVVDTPIPLEYPQDENIYVGGGRLQNMKYSICGRLCEYRMFNYCRNSNDIIFNYNKYIGRYETGLVCYYRFCDDQFDGSGKNGSGKNESGKNKSGKNDSGASRNSLASLDSAGTSKSRSKCITGQGETKNETDMKKCNNKKGTTTASSSSNASVTTGVLPQVDHLYPSTIQDLSSFENHGALWKASRFLEITTQQVMTESRNIGKSYMSTIVQDKRAMGEKYDDEDEGDHPVRIVSDENGIMMLAISTQSLGTIGGSGQPMMVQVNRELGIHLSELPANQVLTTVYRLIHENENQGGGGGGGGGGHNNNDNNNDDVGDAVADDVEEEEKESETTSSGEEEGMLGLIDGELGDVGNDREQ
tara:strand:- start:234 stop:1916 length:1683 start_codon:yes stop_codon:yes gene_type:complete